MAMPTDVTQVAFIRKQHALVELGEYYTANSGTQTGILSSPAVGWVATTPACVIYNSSHRGSGAERCVNLDYLSITTTVVGSAASGLVVLQGAVYLDVGNRYVSGGTDITGNIVNLQMGTSSGGSVTHVYFGAITSTATAALRPICPIRTIRLAVSGTVLDVVHGTKILNFGGVENMASATNNAVASLITVPFPPVVIEPDSSALIYLWQLNGATNVAATYAPELSWWER
jgi:hypothetical protein